MRTSKMGGVTFTTYEGENGVEVLFCLVDGMGHTWPSGVQYFSAKVVGDVSHELSMVDIWMFFQKHPIEVIENTLIESAFPAVTKERTLGDPVTRLGQKSAIPRVSLSSGVGEVLEGFAATLARRVGDYICSHAKVIVYH